MTFLFESFEQKFLLFIWDQNFFGQLFFLLEFLLGKKLLGPTILLRLKTFIMTPKFLGRRIVLRQKNFLGDLGN